MGLEPRLNVEVERETLAVTEKQIGGSNTLFASPASLAVSMWVVYTWRVRVNYRWHVDWIELTEAKPLDSRSWIVSLTSRISLSLTV